MRLCSWGRGGVGQDGGGWGRGTNEVNTLEPLQASAGEGCSWDQVEEPHPEEGTGEENRAEGRPQMGMGMSVVSQPSQNPSAAGWSPPPLLSACRVPRTTLIASHTLISFHSPSYPGRSVLLLATIF